MGVPPQKVETFTCAQCERVFERTRPEEDVKHEAQELWAAEIALGWTMVEVCDDCFNQVMKYLGKEH